MASSEAQYDSDDGMDELMDKFKSQRYKNAFSDSNWEEVSTLFLFVLKKKNVCVNLSDINSL